METQTKDQNTTLKDITSDHYTILENTHLIPEYYSRMFKPKSSIACQKIHFQKIQPLDHNSILDDTNQEGTEASFRTYNPKTHTHNQNNLLKDTIPRSQVFENILTKQQKARPDHLNQNTDPQSEQTF